MIYDILKESKIIMSEVENTDGNIPETVENIGGNIPDTVRIAHRMLIWPTHAPMRGPRGAVTVRPFRRRYDRCDRCSANSRDTIPEDAHTCACASHCCA